MKMTNNVAGMSLGGGRRENFFFSLLEFYPEKNRWFLKSLHQVKDEEMRDRDEIINSWVQQYGLTQLIVDFPLSRPPCYDSCLQDCHGSNHCPRHEVMSIREAMHDLLLQDDNLHKENPKKYEQARVTSLEVDYSKNILNKNPDEHLLSKSFKRKMRKGFVPYWHRPVDFWVWKNYYDQLLDLFKISYESYGNVSVMLLAKLNYLLRHLPKNLSMFESHVPICLIELMRARILSKSTLLQLSDFNSGILAREHIIKQIEKNLGIFIYANDLEIIIKNSQAFESFILSVAGQRMLLKHLKEIPSWVNSDRGNFIVPNF
jgi:hypothetical protein